MYHHVYMWYINRKNTTNAQFLREHHIGDKGFKFPKTALHYKYSEFSLLSVHSSTMRTDLIQMLSLFAANIIFVQCAAAYENKTLSSSSRLLLQRSSTKQNCDLRAKQNPDYKKYFSGIEKMYKNIDITDTCLMTHKNCGWPSRDPSKRLPMFVLSIGLEGAGHHLWTELMKEPVFDCVWINGRHYRRNIGDGVARRHKDELAEGFKEQFKLRRPDPACKYVLFYSIS